MWDSDDDTSYLESFYVRNIPFPIFKVIVNTPNFAGRGLILSP